MHSKDIKATIAMLDCHNCSLEQEYLVLDIGILLMNLLRIHQERGGSVGLPPMQPSAKGSITKCKKIKKCSV